MSAREIRVGDIVRSKITGRTGPVLRVEQYDHGTPRITAELTKGYDTGVPGHHLELIGSADDGRVHDVVEAELQAHAVEAEWAPVVPDPYSVEYARALTGRGGGPESEPEVAGPPVVSSQAGLSAIRHGVVPTDTAAAVVVAALAWEESYDQSSGTHSAIRTGHLMGAVRAHRAAIGGAS